MHQRQKIDHQSILKQNKLRITPGRLLILEILGKAERPLTAAELQSKTAGQLNFVTIYRALGAFVTVGIVKRIDFQQPEVHYEILSGAPHHHHLVCKSCGTVEDVDICQAKKLEEIAIQNSHNFSSITDHALEFFGVCNNCSVIAK